jgi:hypothetical protein
MSIRDRTCDACREHVPEGQGGQGGTYWAEYRLLFCQRCNGAVRPYAKDCSHSRRGRHRNKGEFLRAIEQAGLRPATGTIRVRLSRAFANNGKCRPLLRGVLTAAFPWSDDPDHPGFQRQTCQLAVWCPFCRDWHYHGWDPAYDGRHATHRVAHCHSKDSPFHATGYYISVLRLCDPGYGSHVVRPGRLVTRPIPEWLLKERQRQAAQRATEADQEAGLRQDVAGAIVEGVA